MKRWKTVMRGNRVVGNKIPEASLSTSDDVVTLYIEEVLIKALSADLQAATSLFTVGITLNNTASNFIPGFSLHSSQNDIYMYFNALPFFFPLPTTLPITHCSINNESRMKIRNEALNCFSSPTLAHWPIAPLLK